MFFGCAYVCVLSCARRFNYPFLLQFNKDLHFTIHRQIFKVIHTRLRTHIRTHMYWDHLSIEILLFGKNRILSRKNRHRGITWRAITHRVGLETEEIKKPRRRKAEDTYASDVRKLPLGIARDAINPLKNTIVRYGFLVSYSVMLLVGVGIEKIGWFSCRLRECPW